MEEIEIGAAIHGALQELETRALLFCLPTAPTQCQRRSNGNFVLTDAASKALYDADTAGLRIAQPFIERRDIRFSRRLLATTAPDDPAEAAAEIDDLGRLGILPDARDDRSFLGAKILRLTQEIPRQLLG